MSKTGSKSCVVSLAERNTLYQRASPISTFPVVTEATTCMQWLWPNTGCAVLGYFVAVQKDKQAELLWCPSTRPEQTNQAQPAAAAFLCLFGPPQNLLRLALTQHQSHLAIIGKCPKRLMSSMSVQPSRRCRETANELLDIQRLDLFCLKSTDLDLLCSIQAALLSASPS